mgnify:CR=1 FL=1
MKRKIPIAFAFDGNLIMPACVCLTSLLMNASKETFYDIFILYPQSAKFDTWELDRLSIAYGNCKITYKGVEEDFADAYEVRGITTPAYYRLLIPIIISEYDKVLYSDVDVIFRGDLTHFYDIDIEDYYVAAVDVGVKYREDIRQYVEDVLNLDPSGGYFYSGNLVINSKKIREDGIVESFKMYADRKYRFQDMDIMNIVCNRHIKSISPEFCLTNYLYNLLSSTSIGYSKDELETIFLKGILHFNGAKPWKAICLNQDVWWYYYRKSLIYDENFCHNYYDDILAETDRWSLHKRLRHLIRYFFNKA